MKKRRLGSTGFEVSELGFGCWAIGGTSYGKTSDRDSLAALAAAYDHGVNFFDTADTYGHGHSETLVGETFQENSKRNKVVIATKAGWDFYHGGNKKNFDPDYIRFACDKSLKRLKTDHIDLYQLHNPRLEDIEKGNLFAVLDELKQQGKIRFWGISIHSPQEGKAAIAQGASTVQAIYNLLDQRIRPELFPLCEEHEIGLIAREPLYCGLLTGKYTAASQFTKDDHRNRWMKEKLAIDFQKIEQIKTAFNRNIPLKQAAVEFALHPKAVSVVIPGIKTTSQLEDHLKAVNSPKLTPEELDRIQRLYVEDPLFQTGLYRN